MYKFAYVSEKVFGVLKDARTNARSLTLSFR